MAAPEHVVFHIGLADALGVTEEALERMTMRELAELAFERGGRLTFRAEGGVGDGVTCLGPTHNDYDGEDADPGQPYQREGT